MKPNYLDFIACRALVTEAFFMMWDAVERGNFGSAMYWHFKYLAFKDEEQEMNHTIHWSERSIIMDCHAIADGYGHGFSK